MAVMENLDEKEGDGRMPAKQIIKNGTGLYVNVLH